MRSGTSLLVQAALAGLIAWGLWLPLQDVLAYPDRVSVLPNLQADAAAYHAIAVDLADRWRIATFPAKHPPGWIAMLGMLYSVTGPSYVAGKLLSWTALVVCVGLCAWLARRMYGAQAAWAAAVLSALSPGLRGYVGTLQYEVVTGALLLATLAAAVRVIDAGSSPPVLFRRALLTGMVAGTLVLTRETFALVVPLVAVWIAQRLRPTAGPRMAVLGAALMLAVATAPAVAWSAVQSQREGRLIAISEKGSMVVELGNNPRANGTYNAPLMGIGQPTGLAFVRQFPQRAFVLAIRKVLYFWGVLRDGWNVPRPIAVWVWRATTGLVPLQAIEVFVRGGLLLGAFLFALVLLGREGLSRWWVLPGTVLAVMAVHIVTLASYRFAVPVLGVIYVVVSDPLARLARVVSRSVRAPAVALACCVLLAIVVAMQYQPWPLQLQDDAVDLDGADATNAIDALAGRPTRMAVAQGGVRPVILLTDQYLPAGALAVTVRARRLGPSQEPGSPVARVALEQLDGHTACAMDITGDRLMTGAFADIVLPCRLTKDGPATLLLFSLGVVDLSIDRVSLSWNP